MEPSVKNKSSDSLCSLAWMHTSSEPYGTCRSCCIAQSHVLKDDGKIYSLAEHTVSEIINSKYMKKLRQQMRKGIKPKQCNTCWRDEDNGKESKRLTYNKMAEHLGINIDYNFKELSLEKSSLINIPKNYDDLKKKSDVRKILKWVVQGATEDLLEY